MLPAPSNGISIHCELHSLIARVCDTEYSRRFAVICPDCRYSTAQCMYFQEAFEQSFGGLGNSGNTYGIFACTRHCLMHGAHRTSCTKVRSLACCCVPHAPQCRPFLGIMDKAEEFSQLTGKAAASSRSRPRPLPRSLPGLVSKASCKGTSGSTSD